MSLHLLNRQTELLADILQRSILLSLPARVPQLDWAASISHVLRTEVSTMISLPLPKGACLQAVIILKISGSDRGIQIGRDHPSSGLGCHLPSRIAHRVGIGLEGIQRCAKVTLQSASSSKTGSSSESEDMSGMFGTAP